MEKFPKTKEGTPFREPLEKTEFASQIKSLGNRPDKLIREGIYPRVDEQNLKYFIETFRKGKMFFQKLQESYGINVTQMDYVVGRNENNNIRIFTVVDKIDGKNFKDIEDLSLETKREFDEFYAGLIQHYLDAYVNGGEYWPDFGDGQIMYGHKYGETKNHVYLVDVDPFVFSQKKSSVNTSLLGSLEDICDSIVEIEKKFTQSVKLERARGKLSETANVILKEEHDPEVIEELRLILEKLK